MYDRVVEPRGKPFRVARRTQAEGAGERVITSLPHIIEHAPGHLIVHALVPTSLGEHHSPSDAACTCSHV